MQLSKLASLALLAAPILCGASSAEDTVTMANGSNSSNEPAVSKSSAKLPLAGIRIGVLKKNKRNKKYKLQNQLSAVGATFVKITGPEELERIDILLLDGKYITADTLQNPIVRAAWDRSVPIGIGRADEADKDLWVEADWMHLTTNGSSYLVILHQAQNGSLWITDFSKPDILNLVHKRKSIYGPEGDALLSSIVAKDSYQGRLVDTVQKALQDSKVRAEEVEAFQDNEINKQAGSAPEPTVGKDLIQLPPVYVSYFYAPVLNGKYESGLPFDNTKYEWTQEPRMDFGHRFDVFRHKDSQDVWIVANLYANVNPQTVHRGTYDGWWGLNVIINGFILLSSSHELTLSGEGFSGWDYSPVNSNGSETVTTSLSIRAGSKGAEPAPEASYTWSTQRNIKDWELIANQVATKYTWDYRTSNGSYALANGCYEDALQCYTTFKVNTYNMDSMAQNMSAAFTSAAKPQKATLSVTSKMYPVIIHNTWGSGVPLHFETRGYHTTFDVTKSIDIDLSSIYSKQQ
jgi:hypothetical protein